MAPLAQEIKKRRPFDSLEEEAFLQLWRTFTALAESGERLLRERQLCPTHYNILRILAGEKSAGTQGLPVLEVRERLITRVPDITRLVDKLVELGLITRVRSSEDRRQVLLSLTAAGEQLAADLLPPMQALHTNQFHHMAKDELSTLITLLEKARQAVQVPSAER